MFIIKQPPVFIGRLFFYGINLLCLIETEKEMVRSVKVILVFCLVFLQGIYVHAFEHPVDKKKVNRLNSSAFLNQKNFYSTAIGIRGGYSSGITIKHFVKEDAAVEGIVSLRKNHVSILGLYEKHKYNALSVANLSWEYGLGGHAILFNDINDDRKNNDVFRNDIALGIVAVFGLEYVFGEIPFTLGIDVLPYFDFVGSRNSFLDGSIAFRYVF